MGEWPFGGKRFVEVRGRRMAYVEAGSSSESGLTFVLLHGNPTSSFLWREVIPPLESLGRCVAPDLLGMGDSEKLPDSGPGSYTFSEHGRYLDAMLDALELGDRVVLVLHDWGSALGFDWARRYRERVAGIAYMEAIVQPFTWEDLPAERETFEAFRSAHGEQLVLQDNAFVEGFLPAATIRELAPEEMDEYRRPFRETGESRRPTLSWPRQIPIDGEPADVTAKVEQYGAWLASTPGLPKLFVRAEPGLAIVGGPLETCRRWPDQREVTVAGLHFVQEDSGHQIGEAVAAWAAGLRTPGRT